MPPMDGDDAPAADGTELSPSSIGSAKLHMQGSQEMGQGPNLHQMSLRARGPGYGPATRTPARHPLITNSESWRSCVVSLYIWTVELVTFGADGLDIRPATVR